MAHVDNPPSTGRVAQTVDVQGSYVFDSDGATVPEGPWPLGPEYRLEIVRPGLFSPKPRDLPRWPFLGFWGLNGLGLLATGDYAIFVVRNGRDLVSYAAVVPRFFRFPFMGPTDLQIGPIWTHPDYRGRSIARAVIGEILRAYKNRRCWYLTRAANLASRKVAEGAGLRPVGSVDRTTRFGSRILGSFRLRETGDGS